MSKNPFVGDLLQPDRLKELIEKVSDREIKAISDFYNPTKQARRDISKIAEEAIENVEYQRVLVNLLRHGDKKTRKHVWAQIEYHKEDFDMGLVKKELEEVREHSETDLFIEDKLMQLND